MTPVERGELGRHYQLCLHGKRPAEELPTYLRARLVGRLHTLGWTDREIAVHTYMTLYTTVRIRERLGLSANHAQKGAA